MAELALLGYRLPVKHLLLVLHSLLVQHLLLMGHSLLVVQLPQVLLMQRLSLRGASERGTAIATLARRMLSARFLRLTTPAAVWNAPDGRHREKSSQQGNAPRLHMPGLAPQEPVGETHESTP